MIGDFKRFDMGRRPNRQWRALTPVTWLLSFPKTYKHRAHIDKTELPEQLKPPYFLLCNHNSFMDFKIMTRAIFPSRANYVVAIDGFVGFEWLLRAVGGICNRKFTRSVNLVRNMLHARDNGDIVVLFPEARYSLCGTTASLPSSLGKMIRKMNVPVVTLIMNGHHINSPFWSLGNRRVKPVESKMKLLFTREETQQLPIEEINARLSSGFIYDDYAWQKANRVRVRSRKRAEGLHKVLYQCPACGLEYSIASGGSTLSCTSCGKSWEMTEHGELRALTGPTEFSHIPDWYEWQRMNVRREVENGEYLLEAKVRIDSLPNAKGFVTFSEPGYLTHDMSGFTLSGSFEGNPFDLRWQAQSMHSCHIEYDFKGKGECLDLSTTDDTFYLFPDKGDLPVTKIALATEELYRFFAEDEDAREVNLAELEATPA